MKPMHNFAGIFRVENDTQCSDIEDAAPYTRLARTGLLLDTIMNNEERSL